MTNRTTNSALPHHSLIAWHVAVRLLVAMREMRIGDAELRRQAMKAATSTVCNCAEGGGRVSKADKARVFGIARGEMTEAIACVEVAGLLGVADAEEVERCVGIARELNAMLRALCR